MAVFFRGLSMAERVALTRAMTDSGTVLEWSLPGPVLDKHSTGGVGDKVSLMLAPLIAACGGFVPMISGRALGHTGGTLDKLDSIPGYDSAPDVDRFRRVVRQAGCSRSWRRRSLHGSTSCSGSARSPSANCGSIATSSGTRSTTVGRPI